MKNLGDRAKLRWEKGSCPRRLEICSSIVPINAEYRTLTSTARISNKLQVHSSRLTRLSRSASPFSTSFSPSFQDYLSLSLAERLPGKDTIEFTSCTSKLNGLIELTMKRTLRLTHVTINSDGVTDAFFLFFISSDSSDHRKFISNFLLYSQCGEAWGFFLVSIGLEKLIGIFPNSTTSTGKKTIKVAFFLPSPLSIVPHY